MVTLQDGILKSLRAREMGLGCGHAYAHRPNVGFLFGNFTTSIDNEHNFYTYDSFGFSKYNPPLCLSFSTYAMEGHALAAGDEDGNLFIIDTRKSFYIPPENCNEIANSTVIRHFIPHKNAIFDVTWLKNDHAFMTACGDKTVRITDSYTGFRIAKLKGCSGSVKCVKAKPFHEKIIASASRDGQICLYDLRVNAKFDPDESSECIYFPVIRVNNAHERKLLDVSPSSGMGFSNKRRRIFAQRRYASSVVGSVTSLAFSTANEHVLFSGGAADGAIKLWDLRYLSYKNNDCGKENTDQRYLPVTSIVPSLLRSGREYGVAHLDMDASGENLLVSCTDSSIYVCRAMNLEQGPKKVLTGHCQTSFYIKSRFSPCGNFVISGSSDSKAYIWDLNRKSGVDESIDPIVQLDGHCGGEVSGVDWCKVDVGIVATCGDDARAKVWKIDRTSRPLPARTDDSDDDEFEDDGAGTGCIRRSVPNKARLCARRRRELSGGCGRKRWGEKNAKCKKRIGGFGGGGQRGVDEMLPGRKRYRNTDIRDFFFASTENLSDDDGMKPLKPCR